MRVAVKALVAVAGLALALTMPVAAPVQAETPASVQGLPDVADVVDKLLPAVVEISVQAKNPDAPDGAGPLDDNPFKNFFDEFLKRKQQGETQPKDAPKDAPKDSQKDAKPNDNGDQPNLPNNLQSSLGSGFIIDPKGLIVTNNHVIADAVNIQVHLQDGTILKGELVGHDPKADIAVVRVKPEHDLPFVNFGDSDKARVGQWVIAIGNPFGLGGSVSLGIVSAKARDINAGPYDDFIQTDATINKGNSGGPLFNLKGEVIGVNTAIFSPSGGSVGIGFAVPANEARVVANQLIKYGETRRGWLGVKLQTLTPDVAEGLGMAKPQGALVAEVTPQGPSDKGGMKSGDVITKFDGRDIADSRVLRRVVAETDVGKEVDVTVLRDGKEQALKVTLGRLEEGEKQVAAADAGKPDPVAAPPTADVLGMKVSDISDALRAQYKLDAKQAGAVVTAVAADSAAADKGIGEGDVITEAGGQKVSGAADVAAAVDQATKDAKNTILMLVTKGGTQDSRFVALRLKK